MTKRIVLSKPAGQPTTFKPWDMLPLGSQDELRAEMRRRGNLDWAPGDVVEVESSAEIERIMKQRPAGAQAVIGGKK